MLPSIPEVTLMIRFLSACILLILSANMSWAGTPGIPLYVKGKYSVPATSATVGEGRAIFDLLDEKEKAKLIKEGVVLSQKLSNEGEVKGMITALILVKQPRAKVYEMLTNPSIQSKYLPRLNASKTVTKKESGEITAFTVKVSFISVKTEIVHQWWPEISRMAWTLNPKFDNDMKVQDGYYNVYSLDENTSLLEFGTELQTSGVPQFVQDYLVKSDLPEALQNVKKYQDSGGTFRK